MATADNDLQFLEGETFHTQKEANKGQVAVKRSSTLKSTKRRTLAKESTKPKLSVEDIQLFVGEFPEAVSLLQKSCSVNLKTVEDLDPLLYSLQTIEKVLEEQEKMIDDFCSKENGIGCLLKLLIDIPTDGDIATECCWILSNICTNRTYCSDVMKQDGCSPVIAVMKRHKTVPLQHSGLAALCNMAIVEENRPVLCERGVLYAVVNAFDVCPRSEWVVYTGAQVVQNISGAGSLCTQVVQAHLIQKMNKFVEFMCDHDELMQSVCWTVSCVAFATDDDNRVALYEDGAIAAVTTALRSSPDHPGVQFTGLSALSNLCRAELLISKVLELKGIDVVHLALTNHERHQGIQAIGLRTLVLLSSDDIALRYIASLGIDSLCKRSLREFPEGPIVAEANELLKRIKASQPRSLTKNCTVS